MTNDAGIIFAAVHCSAATIIRSEKICLFFLKCERFGGKDGKYMKRVGRTARKFFDT